jgi:hypothetical protein
MPSGSLAGRSLCLNREGGEEQWRRTPERATHARVIRPFAHWFVLRRARRAATRRTFTRGSADFARARVIVALDLLSWLDQRGQSLRDLVQADLDRIDAHAGRNTARLTLAAELPASVLADLTGISVSTAERWSQWAKRDWAAYVGQRTADDRRDRTGGQKLTNRTH